MNTLRQNQHGFSLIAVLAIIAFILLGLVLMKLSSKNETRSTANKQTSQQQSSNNAEEEEDDSTQSAETSTSLLTSNMRKSRDVSRKNDASRLAGSTLEYVANNTGLFPIAFEDGKLVGGGSDSEVEFKHYKTTSVQRGDHAALTTDDIMLVTGASCGPNGEAIESTSRSAAIIYALEGDGTWKSICLDV